MIQPANIPIGADRWVPCIRTIAFIGIDLTGATFSAQVRTKPDASGSPLVDLATVTTSSAEGVMLVYGGTDTVANHITAGRLSEVPPGYTSASSAALTLVGIRLNETTMEGLPFPQETGDDQLLYWDMLITPAGGVKDKYAGGTFTVRAGVDQS